MPNVYATHYTIRIKLQLIFTHSSSFKNDFRVFKTHATNLNFIIIGDPSRGLR